MAEKRDGISRMIQAGVLIVDAEENNILDANEAALKSIRPPEGEVLRYCCRTFVCPARKGQCTIINLHTTVGICQRFLLNASRYQAPISKSVARIVGGSPSIARNLTKLTSPYTMKREDGRNVGRTDGHLLPYSTM